MGAPGQTGRARVRQRPAPVRRGRHERAGGRRPCSPCSRASACAPPASTQASEATLVIATVEPARSALVVGRAVAPPRRRRGRHDRAAGDGGSARARRVPGGRGDRGHAERRQRPGGVRRAACAARADARSSAARRSRPPSAPASVVARCRSRRSPSATRSSSARARSCRPTGGCARPRPSLDEAAMTGEAIPVTRAHGAEVRVGDDERGRGLRARGDPAGGRERLRGAGAAGARARRQPGAVRAHGGPVRDLVPGGDARRGRGGMARSGDPVRALAVLVVATPCPLILAAPVALVSGVSAAARRGVIVKGASVIEALGRVRSVVLDKTGTLTLGAPRVERGHPDRRARPGRDPASGRLARPALGAHARQVARRGGARARRSRLEIPTDAAEGVGEGITGTGGRAPGRWSEAPPSPPARGSARRASPARPRPPRPAASGRAIVVAVDGAAAGVVVMADKLRPDAATLIADLHAHRRRPRRDRQRRQRAR